MPGDNFCPWMLLYVWLREIVQVQVPVRKPIIVRHFKWNWIGYFGPLHRSGYQERIKWTFPISWNAIITYTLLTKREVKMTRYWWSSHGPWICFDSVYKDAKMAHISSHLDRTSLVIPSELESRMTCLFPSSGKENQLLKRVFEIHRTDWKQKRFENVPVMINKRQPSRLNSIKYPHKLPRGALRKQISTFWTKKEAVMFFRIMLTEKWQVRA